MTAEPMNGPDCSPTSAARRPRRQLAPTASPRHCQRFLKIVTVRAVASRFRCHVARMRKPMHWPNGLGCSDRPRQPRSSREQPGGLVVDYLGPRRSAQAALAHLHRSGGKGEPPPFDTPGAIAVMLEKHGILDLLHGFDWSACQRQPPPSACAPSRRPGAHPGFRRTASSAGCRWWLDSSPRLRPMLRSDEAAGRSATDVSFFQALQLPSPSKQPTTDHLKGADRRRHPPAGESGDQHRRPGDRRVHRSRPARPDIPIPQPIPVPPRRGA